jgi:hypothetical protein
MNAGSNETAQIANAFTLEYVLDRRIASGILMEVAACLTLVNFHRCTYAGICTPVRFSLRI